MCRKPCTVTTLENKCVSFCPVTGEAAEWRQVNGRASEKIPQAAGAKEEGVKS
ncbi:hypothetical protein L1S32_00110 [Methanogenium sp. S4BF]|uniref:hypothetical protein n=1 Tax=Methanogenium sp. S4BF TaxID=1789226 RepID=UPI0024180AE6|nr:hypothetical protein [Methanogenium sp. S4BF]WFN34560.1 hypothetical protein L1S32_00110 [Methanogenium sp. S4BF]